MNAKQILLLGVAAGSISSCSPGKESAGDGVAHFTAADQDSTVRLEDDFYQSTNGGWIAQHPIPGDRARYGAFDMLYEESIENLHAIVDEAQKANAPKGTEAQKIGDLFKLGMDTLRRDSEGIEPIKGYLAKARAAKFSEPAEFANLIGTMHTFIASPFFSFGCTPDYENSSVNISELWQAGIGLPDRDYYFDETERGAGIISSYKVMIAKLLTIAGLDNSEARAEAIFALEKQLAEIMNTKEENRNPQAVSNKNTLATLKELSKGFDWDTYFATLGAEVKDINVGQVKYFSKVFDVVAKADTAVVADYLTYKTISGFSSCLTSEIYAVRFDFYGRVLSGTQEMRPLWKRTLGTVEECMGEALGRLYVERHFPEAAKKRMVDLIEQLRISFGERIDALTWMGDSTKMAAHEKLAAIKVKVGYPDKWKDYSTLEIDPAKSYAENLVAVSIFQHKEEMAKINNPVDKDEWFMTPQTVNAYYNPMGNEIVFPAAILQPPFFYANGDDAVNFGAIGVVIGHEMTHGFDDQGRQFDKEGNLKNWWTEADCKEFEKATSRLVDYFGGLTAIDSLKINGRLTLGENIADLGGLNIAHQAFRNTLKGKSEPAPIDGQTAEQRFLLGYSRIWANAIRDEALYQQVQTDPHSPGRLRVNGQLPLLDFFYSAFDVKEGDKMYLAPADRIAIW
ncbi:MAG: M13 family metallopeptidase [Bacteroidales bacterium]|nr:M13 family metallopeptidase [Bacteroidales bacterium]MDD7724105.1 M13 family metallopeptidase [Bacteroidales bacterium]